MRLWGPEAAHSGKICDCLTCTSDHRPNSRRLLRVVVLMSTAAEVPACQLALFPAAHFDITPATDCPPRAWAFFYAHVGGRFRLLRGRVLCRKPPDPSVPACLFPRIPLGAWFVEFVRRSEQ
jgi:hypothetical protein